MLKTSTVCLIALIAFVLGIAFGVLAHRKYAPCINLPIVSYDTTVVRDTINAPVPPAKRDTVVRHDTVRFQLDPINKKATIIDTLKDTNNTGYIELPIEQKTYETEDYRAYVSGWHPALDSIQVYKRTEFITKTVQTVKRPVWALTANIGAGYTTAGTVLPYAGLGVGVVLWSK